MHEFDVIYNLLTFLIVLVYRPSKIFISFNSTKDKIIIQIWTDKNRYIYCFSFNLNRDLCYVN